MRPEHKALATQTNLNGPSKRASSFEKKIAYGTIKFRDAFSQDNGIHFRVWGSLGPRLGSGFLFFMPDENQMTPIAGTYGAPAFEHTVDVKKHSPYTTLTQDPHPYEVILNPRPYAKKVFAAPAA
ncbi:hypothetical protein ZHAS_00004549 [Anopheles sinensis]|uniref:Uncharacterized protein n=1 Tax=Anopheles sinensis TaxID=74873 RepID=A0A084VHH3_ANOSI|nr:hypothetical protein ZHAS_00004549 [Anopheles sinensis]